MTFVEGIEAWSRIVRESGVDYRQPDAAPGNAVQLLIPTNQDAFNALVVVFVVRLHAEQL